MGRSIRETIEEREREFLGPFAMLSAESRGRMRDENPDAVRTCFQRDRDRILHSKPFRRLKHKTQVFIDPVGDHYRTRLTHSLEVAQIARTVGRALRLNEDLIEAIAIGHDVGHTPFGHIGEEALDEVLKQQRIDGLPQKFRHYEQSLRIVDLLEDLNLTHEVRDGIGGHSKGRRDLTDHEREPVSTLEAAVVRVSDRIAYMNHDLDDAVRSGIIDSVPDAFQQLGKSHGKRVSAMVLDVIENSLDQPAVRFSPAMLDLMNELKEWLYENVYLQYPRVYPDIGKAKHIVRELFLHYLGPGTLPDGFDGPQGALDYVAGMTDRFAIEKFKEIFIPTAFEERIRTVL
ncbi:MAG: deoxyguanosinetriphosphate triphosphohydrolase [Armatimonadetes bacterium]|nr:deoxyguanosinetriphosphate triphosphohydrolase [Armatimonadota bacterium]